MRFLDIFVGQGLLEQACRVKLNYFNAFSTGICGGEVWKASVVGERVCSSLGGAWRFSKNIEAGGLARARNHKICSLARISLPCGAAVGIWNCHMACKDIASNILVARPIGVGQIV